MGDRINAVDHPPHYSRGGIEAIDVIEAWDLGFHLGNALKYIARAGHKNSASQDIDKAIWYLQRWQGRFSEKVIPDD